MKYPACKILFFQFVPSVCLLVLTCLPGQWTKEKTKPNSFLLNLKIDNLPKQPDLEKLGFHIRIYNCAAEDLKAYKAQPKKNLPVCLKAPFSSSHPSQGLASSITIHPTVENFSWTHLSIELTGIESIKGMYSPGHNPFWVTNGENTKDVSINHTFHFVSQENLIPDEKQKKLAETFSPILVFHKDKKVLPTNMEKYFPNYSTEEYPLPGNDIRRYSTGKESWKYMIFPDEKKNQGDTHLYYHVRYAKSTVSGTQKEALPGFRDNWNYWYEEADGDMVISYWIWYDFNEGPTSFGNVHQGDLESYSILVSKEGKPKRIMLTGHDHVLLDTSFQNINSLNSHPILYVAKGNKGADGGNPTSAYEDYTVKLEAGNFLFNWISDPEDIFPVFDSEKSLIIIPDSLDAGKLEKVKIGSGLNKTTHYVDARKMILKRIVKLVAWEEPGWIGKKADKDPDGNHTVSADIEKILSFEGRLGKHPRGSLVWRELKQYGESPENAPFKTNIEQHFSFESPRIERNHEDRKGNYGPKWAGDEKTPQTE
ncbi:hypothetical protein [Leptospira ilyithenensis]|uniref:Uncharacterized protein n=1 Tax=Leptospira ilyithenensis TaxID=2484901 RepID=A0A4R9LIR1_9LEPT|nr:hypothetical protein [Leptospira ilyithenensis]TGN06536.1 hypothetical protein EHS11_19480 [Leptospira ilyithenensis]